MTRERWRAVARVEKAHGRKGGLVAAPVHGLPFLLRAGLRVAAVPPPLRGERHHVIVRCADGTNAQLVTLEDVDDRGAAEALAGKTLLAREADLPELDALDEAVGALGLEVVDARLGAVGRIEEVMGGAGAPVWVVRGVRGEVLIPAVDAFVREVDAGAGIVAVSLPQGLAPWDEG